MTDILKEDALNTGKVTSEEADQLTNILQLEGLKLGASSQYVLKVFEDEHFRRSIERQEKLKMVLDRWQQCEWREVNDNRDDLDEFCEEYFSCKPEIQRMIASYIGVDEELKAKQERTSCVGVKEAFKKYDDNFVVVQTTLNELQAHRENAKENFIIIQENFNEAQETISELKNTIEDMRIEILGLKSKVAYLEGIEDTES